MNNGPTINEADLDFLRAGEDREEQDDLFDDGKDEDLDRQNEEADEAAEEDREQDEDFYVTFTQD